MSSARLTAAEYIEQYGPKDGTRETARKKYVESFLEHLSVQPWSEYTAADYSVEQWHNACLIHQHPGPATSKSQCKLPIRTPTGAVNKNAIHSAAAALAGARGGVHASSDEKASAARTLVRLYRQMNEEPPPSLLKHSELEHYGVPGMRWGVKKRAKEVAVKAVKGPDKKTVYEKPAKKLSNAELQKRIKRLELEKKYSDLNKKESSAVKEGGKFTARIMNKSGEKILTTMASGAGLLLISLAMKKKMHPQRVKDITGKDISIPGLPSISAPKFPSPGESFRSR